MFCCPFIQFYWKNHKKDRDIYGLPVVTSNASSQSSGRDKGDGGCELKEVSTGLSHWLIPVFSL